MIPLKLQIKNFLSYGADPQTIEFGHYPLICLSGKNGHGKSALLDALTWALWGQARKLGGNAKADQGLLRLGQTQMMVCLDFECAGQRYRIKREYMQTYGKPVAILDFGLFDTANDRFVSLTEKTIRDTQAKIDQMLHLTFDAFINSAFLRQGQANEFSKKSPKERKDVLASILGLDRYETIRRLAAERIKQTSNYKMHLQTLQTKLESELAQETSIGQKLAELAHKSQEIAAHEQQLHNTKKILEQEHTRIQEKKQQIAMLLYRQQQIKEEQIIFADTLCSIRMQWRTVHKQQLAKIDYAALEQQKKERIQEIQTHQKTLQEQLSFKQELLAHKETAARIAQEFHEKKSNQINTKKIAIERLHDQNSQLETKIKETQILAIKYSQELQATHAQSEQLKKQLVPQHSYTALEKQFEKRKEYYQRWVAQANMINGQLATIERKSKLVHDEESPSCPLCEQNLSASRKRFLKNKYEDEITFLKLRLARLSTLIQTLKPMLIEQHKQLEKVRADEQQAHLINLKIEELCKAVAKYEADLAETSASILKHQELQTIVTATIQAEQKSLEQLLASSKQELEKVPAFKETQQEIAKLEQKLAKHAYNQTDHEQAAGRLAHLEKQLADYKELQQQHLLQTERAKQIATHCAQLKALKIALKEIELQCAAKLTIELDEKKWHAQKQEMEKAAAVLAQQKELLVHEKGSLENQKATLDQVKQEYHKQQKELVTCAQTIDDYQAIALATGKDGIQALLIEDAIPEIEHETNELLAKLTDNQTQLFIESLRDLKKGGTKETLDIKISDAAGIRPYELFSGGEAFRIDFALRIAISKLLARRAGTSLQTLIIDEGFGSQDEDGLSHIMDALYKIQQDFAKIIIVSHLSSMKNQFPVHFVIDKGPNGSIVEVLEQG